MFIFQCQWSVLSLSLWTIHQCHWWVISAQRQWQCFLHNSVQAVMCTRCVPNICWGSDLMASALSGSHSCCRDMLLLHWVWPQKSRLVWVYIWVCRWFHCCHFSTFGEIFLRNVIVIVFDDSLSFSSHWSAVVLPVIKLSFCSHCHLVFCFVWLKLTLSWGTGTIICNGTRPTSSTSDCSMGRLPAWAIVDSIERWVAVASKSPSTKAYWNYGTFPLVAGFQSS